MNIYQYKLPMYIAKDHQAMHVRTYVHKNCTVISIQKQVENMVQWLANTAR